MSKVMVFVRGYLHSFGYIGIFVLLVQTSSFAQVQVQLDSNKHLVGDRIVVKININGGKGSNIFFDKPDIEHARLELLDSIISNWEKTDKGLILHQEYHVGAYDSGKFYFPAITYRIQNKQGDSGSKTIKTDSLMISVYRMPVDTTLPPKPIKGIAEIPYTFQEFLPYIIGAGILLIIGIIIILYRRKKAEGGFATKAPPLPPFEEAMAALSVLRKDKMWERGDIKDYYITLTDILRRYISRRWNIDAFEMTTAEIMRTIKKEHIESAYRRQLRETLELSDLVKFAKHTAIPEENLRSIEHATAFIQATRPIEKENDIHVLPK